MESSGGDRTNATDAAEESVLSLDGEETLSEKGSVGLWPGPGTPKGSGKEAPSGGSATGSKRKHNCLNADRLEPNGPDLATCSSGDSTWSLDSLDDHRPLSLSRKRDGHSENSVTSGDGVAMIRQPRGVLRLRKLAQNISAESGRGGNIVVSSDVAKSTQHLRRKRKRKLGALKENRVGGDDPVSCLKTENGSCDHDNSKKVSSEKDFSVEKQLHLSGEPSKPVHADKKISGHVQEDDEVNLEENAARMLCSLSDHRCAGPSKKRTQSPDRLLQTSFLHHSNDFKNSDKEVHNVEGPARLLRKRDDKASFRKRRPRRHFYEVCPRDVDPFCIVKERIRVFWPLDETWYFGLVKEYDPVTRLHHVRYDDKDEEWIDLQNERFKLLLLPGEAHNRSNWNNSRSVFKPKYEEDEREDMDGNSTGSSDSEPIISWLARANQAKSAASSVLNKHTYTHSNGLSALPDEKQSVLSNLSCDNLDKLCSNGATPSSSLANGNAEILLGSSLSGDRRLPLVYYRKRFHKRKNGFRNISEQDFSPKRMAGSMVFASNVGSESGVEASASMQMAQVSLILSLPLKSVYRFIYAGCSIWFSKTLFFLQHGTLVSLWPIVHLDMLFVDNALGLKYFLFETCLRSAVCLFCLLVGTFHKYPGQGVLKESKVPCTSVRFRISGLRGASQAVFLLFSFFGIRKSKWKCLEGKLQHYCLKKELPKVDCTYANIKQLTNGSDRRVSTSLDLFSKDLLSGCQKSLFPPESIYSDDPLICYLNEQREFSGNDLHVTPTPSLLLCWHLKLLIETNLTSNGFLRSMSFNSKEDQSNEDISTQVSQNTTDMVHQSATASGFCSPNVNSSTDGLVEIDTVGCINYSPSSASRELNAVGSTASLRYNDNNSGEADVTLKRSLDENGSHIGADEPCSSNLHDLCSTRKPEERCPSINASRKKTSDPADEHLFNKGEEVTQPVSNLVQELNEYPIGRTTPTAPRTTCHRNRFTSISRTFGDGSKLWPEDLMLSGFAGGSKKPRTQVSYSFSPRGDDLGSKHKGTFRKMQSHSNVKANNAKRVPDNSKGSQSSPELLTCVANVLVTVGDRGWREHDAHITMDSDGQNEWRVCVKLSDGTKYTHKVCQVLQPGATNRYTHAMIWKGGSEWCLEFPDRSQWLIFKQIHEECYSRNIRAASVKNIPIPGVRLVAEAYNYDGNDLSYVRPQNYIGHTGADIELALDESRVMYDMDSDDEDWLSNWRKSLVGEGNTTYEVTEDLFERIMDKFEKLAYAYNCNELTIDQMKEHTVDIGPLDIVRMIHDYWQDKRLKKGTPLIRHYQPAMWKIYEKDLHEWESAVYKIQGTSNGYQEKSLPPKPALFAFCLRPRGLQIPYKGLKQRSHKKLMYSGCHGFFSREQDVFCRSGKKYNEYAGDGRNCESFDTINSPAGYSPRFSARADSPRAVDASERGATPRFYRANSFKRSGSFAFSEDHQPSPSFRHQKAKRSTSDHWNNVIHEWQNSKHLFPGGLHSHRVDIEELKLRDATSAAQHAATMAKLKRERAHYLMHKADLALHRASVALMIADAIRASERDSLRDDRRDLRD